jgi:hypothetical protein
MIDQGEFTACVQRASDQFGYFEIAQRWMESCDISTTAMGDFLLDLLESSRKLTPVHGIVLPEVAMPKKCADEVAARLSKESDIELLITGTLAKDFSGVHNCATIYRMYKGQVLQPISQSKHHRWCLNPSQLSNYDLESHLDPKSSWWEQIEIEERACSFEVLRHGASFSVLVCEDLARFDPVFPVISSVGPSLVVALLMDGPQLKERWSGRYATTLADDPGSAVLTLTSLGMIRKSRKGASPPTIGLWKDPLGGYHQIDLGSGDQAVLISLELTSVSQWTLDGRCDNGAAQAFKLTACKGIRGSRIPNWAS